jgi:two-component sensor histidine kinase
LGPLVNELVTNALKYAFGEEGGSIRVTLCVDPAIGEGCLTVEDNGRGMPADAAPGTLGSRGGGLGTKLVEAFVSQLNGRLEREPVDRGTKVRVLSAGPVAVEPS